MDHNEFLSWDFKIEEDEYHTFDLLFEKYRSQYPVACMLCIDYCVQSELKYRQEKKKYNKCTMRISRYRARLLDMEHKYHHEPGTLRENDLCCWLSASINGLQYELSEIDKILDNIENNYAYVTDKASECEARGNPSKAHW